MAKSILIFIVILFTTNIALSKRVMLDSLELSSIKNFYYSTDSSMWYRDDFSKLYFGKIYPNEDFIHSNLPKVRITFDRDTTIKGEEIGIYKFKVLNFDEMIVQPGSYNPSRTLNRGRFISGTFSKLEELRISGCDLIDNEKQFFAPNLKVFKSHYVEFTTTIDLNQFQNLEVLDFYLFLNNFDLVNINLPKCKTFKIIGSKLSTTLSISNLENVEEFKICDDYYPPLNGIKFNMWLEGTDINQVLSYLKNVKSLSIANTYLNAEIPELNFPNLEFLELQSNLFKGKFPKLNTPKLKFLRIGSNRFDSISDTIKLDNLEYFDFSFSDMSSKLPVFITPNLKYLDFSRAFFTGNLDPNLFKSNKLRYIDLSHNMLDGEINFEINNENLECLNLGANKFSGQMPSVIAVNLSNLNLEGNQFDKLFDSLKVNPTTFVRINNNKISPNEMALYCEDAINESRLSNLIHPTHILEFSKHDETDTSYFRYSGTDVFDVIFYNSINQNNSFTTFFNENTNKFEIDGLNTSIFTYKVFKYDGNDFVETGLSIWDYIPEVGNYQIRAYSKYCDFEYQYPPVNIKKLSVESLIIDCKNIIPIEYYDLLGNKLNQTEIYNRQIVVRYKCLETGELFHKLEIKEPR